MAAVLLASGVLHTVVWMIDGGSWEGAVSWRKPILFGVSFGLALLSVGWVQGLLPRGRVLGWATTWLIGGAGLAEVALITAQRWRGEASHFNVMEPTNSMIFTLMGVSIGLLGLGMVVLAIWAVARLRRPMTDVVAVFAGLALLLAGSAVGQDLIQRGLAYADEHDSVPAAVIIGAAGSGKLAHAVALHGLQVLGVLALLLGRSALGRTNRSRVMVLATVGYVAVTGLVAAQAYAGRSMLDLSVSTAAGLAAAATAVVAAFGLAVLGRDAARR